MSIEEFEVLVVGAGQAGIAMSEHLQAHGIHHVVLERSRIAERWRTERWDSLVANGPAWHDRFPGMDFAHTGPDEFASKDEIAEYFAAYAAHIRAPIRCGVEVQSAKKSPGKSGYDVQTSDGPVRAHYVVAATGAFQHPVIPKLIPREAPVEQLHSSSYRNPDQLTQGNVLVIGAGSSGVQIADELQASGRQVYLAVGAHDRPPRSYRGRDFVWWLGVLGKWEDSAPPAGSQHVTIAVSGARGGSTVDFRALAKNGIHLTGRAEVFEHGIVRFAADLAENITKGDANYLSVLDEADAYVAQNGLDLPEEPEARMISPDPPSMNDPTLQLDLVSAGITTVIWATGFTQNFDWLHVDSFDGSGRPLHKRGVSPVPGVYFLGLPWQSRRGSSFIWGVWHDAKYIADQIMIQRGYASYRKGAAISPLDSIQAADIEHPATPTRTAV
ncbi:NAD(P)/FAD-dependent oxidoreductase [Nesterenkonia populi]